MLHRALPVLAWAAVTFLVTAVGYVAIITVGDVLRGSGPLGEDFSIAEQSDVAPDGPAIARRATHSHPLGELTAQCVGRVATLLEMRPAPGATVTDTDLGPDEDIHIDVEHAGVTLRLEIYCNRGEPRLVTELRS